MKTRILLFLQRVLNGLVGKVNVALADYQYKQNLAYAESFLKKFRSGEGRWTKAEGVVPVPLIRKRKSCAHVKGGMSRRPMGYKDYSLACHTFLDGTQQIWCLQNCGFKVKHGDEGWSQAVTMMEQSSNSPSSSERALVTQ